MRYTKLTLGDVIEELCRVADDAATAFGGLDLRQLNWRPDETQWSVAQCLEHLVTANDLMLRSAENALTSGTTTLWQRVPLLPLLFGQLLIRSQAPNARGKFTAPARAQPSRREISTDIVPRFVTQHRRATEWMRSLDERAASRTTMISPFVRVVSYSVLDGLRLLAAHDQRHLAQARRVMRAEKFPRV